MTNCSSIAVRSGKQCRKLGVIWHNDIVYCKHHDPTIEFHANKNPEKMADIHQRRSLIMTEVMDNPRSTRAEIEAIIPRDTFTLASDITKLVSQNYLHSIFIGHIGNGYRVYWVAEE